MLTLDELSAEVEPGDRHGRLRLHRHAGPAAGQARARGVLPRADRPSTGIEGCNYLLALDMEMEPQAGYAMASWERGYGDFHLTPDLATLRRIPWLEGTALVLCDVGLGRRLAGRRLAAPGAARAGRAGAGGRLRADGRLRARVLPAQGELRRGAREALPRPDAVGAVHPRLPHPRDHLRRAADPADPQRHARRRDPGRELEGRGVARPARDQLPLRRRADDGRQPRRSTRTAPRRSRTRTAARSPSWRSPTTRWIGSSCHVHSSLWRDGENAFAGESEMFRQFLAGLDRVRARARALPRADDQLVQALRGRQLGADDARLGPRQPHVRLPHRRARPSQRVETRIPGGDVEPVPRVRGADRRRACTGSSRARAAAAARGQRLRVGRRAVPVDAARGDRGARGGHDGARPRSATRSSTTT